MRSILHDSGKRTVEIELLLLSVKQEKLGDDAAVGIGTFMHPRLLA